MINLVLGRQGSGKSLFLVAKALESYKNGKTIYSNMHLNFPYEKINIKDIVDCKLENGFVILDEIHNLLSSRNSLSILSRKICDGFISMVRKKNLEIWGTTQLLRKVDIRIRDEKDYIYECFKYVLINGEWIHWIRNDDKLPKDAKILLKIDEYDMYSSNKQTYNLKANNYYKYYNTNEIIKIEGIDEYEKELKNKK